jgi:hypothetical protein
MWKQDWYQFWAPQRGWWQNIKFHWWRCPCIALQTSKPTWIVKTCVICRFLLRLAYILPLLKSLHAFIEFAQMRNDFVCDLMEVIKVCQSDIYKMYCDQITKCKYVKVGQSMILF